MMRVLVILPRFPYPLEKGDKLRAYHQIRVLSEHNEIFLFALSHDSVGGEALEEVSHLCKDVRVSKIGKLCGKLRAFRNIFSVKSLQIGYWYSKHARKELQRYVAEVKPDVVYAQMIRTMKYATSLNCPKVLDFQDALSMNFERRMMSHKGLPYFFMHYEFKMLRSAEYTACTVFDGLTIISEADRNAIPQPRNTEIDVVRNGVDFDFYKPDNKEKKNDIVFCGNMQYKPNIDAAKYLVEEIMPIVWSRHPEATVVLAGATPSASVRRLAGARVSVTGSVDDIRPCYASSRIFVAPMRIGSGLQNKLLEAMAMAVPCVTTSLANASLGAADGEEVMIGDNAQQMADAIVELLDDSAKRDAISLKGNAFVRENFSWEKSGHVLEQVLMKAKESYGKF